MWGFGKCKSIERIHLKFCKALLKVRSSTPSLGVYGDLGRYPLYISRYVRIIKFWSHILSTENILVSYFYNHMVEACSNGAKKTGLVMSSHFWIIMVFHSFGPIHTQLI